MIPTFRFMTAGGLVGLMLCAFGCARDSDEGPPTGYDSEMAQRLFELNFRGLLSANPQTRAQALDVIRRNWSGARASVAALAQSPKLPERLAAAYLLAQLAEHDDVPALHAFLADSSPRVRVAVLPAVARLRDETSQATLVRRAESADFDELKAILETLRQVDAAGAEQLCLQQLANTKWGHRRAAALALGQFESERSSQALVQALLDENWMVGEAAAEALGLRREVTTREHLVSLARHKQWQLRAVAAKALAGFGTSADFEIIREIVLTDPSKYVRRALVPSLAAFPTRAVPVLARVIEETSDRKLIIGTIETLVRLGDPPARAVLSKLTESEDETIRSWALRLAGDLLAPPESGR